MQYTDIGIDLGTASILVYIRGKGVVLKEPSVVAFDRDTDKIKAIGEEARLMLGRTPGNIVAIRPLRQGVISDYETTEKMMKYFIQKAIGKKTFRKPRTIRRLCFFLIYRIIASSKSSPAILMEALTTVPPNEITAISEVPPPISTIILPQGLYISIPAPIAAAIGSSIINTSLAPACSVAS